MTDSGSDRSETTLIHRRQFIMSNRRVDLHPDWPGCAVAQGRLQVRHHPELAVTTAEHAGLEVTLLGYALDPMDPDADTSAIVQRLAADGATIGLTEATHRLGGRWAVVGADESGIRVFTDPCGFRQVFHAVRSIEGSVETTIASQPRLLAAELGLQPDAAALEQFVAHQVRPDHEFWWPGDRTLYAEVRHLLPNHLLDLTTGEVSRHWPTAPLEPVPFDVASSQLAGLLRGQLVAASRHHSLAHAVTAGLDSRLGLAAARDVASTIDYYTTVMYDMTIDSDDVVVTKKLLTELGLDHRVLFARPEMSDDFAEIWEEMNAPSHQCWGEVAEGMLDGYDQQRVTIHGAAGEIGRGFYRPRPDLDDENVDASHLLARTRMPDEPFVRSAFEEWLRDAGPAAAHAGIDLLELFYWEQRVGNWAGSAQCELDAVHETFSPFDNRMYLATMLAAPAESKKRPGVWFGKGYRLHHAVIEQLWSDAARIPVNPVPFTRKVRRHTHRLLRRMGVGPLIDRLRGRGPTRG